MQTNIIGTLIPAGEHCFITELRAFKQYQQNKRNEIGIAAELLRTATRINKFYNGCYSCILQLIQMFLSLCAQIPITTVT